MHFVSPPQPAAESPRIGLGRRSSLRVRLIVKSGVQPKPKSRQTVAMQRAIIFSITIGLGLAGCRAERPVDGNRVSRYRPSVDAGVAVPPKADAGRPVGSPDAGSDPGDDHGDDAAHATLTQVDWTARGTLTAGDVDWFEFVALPADLHVIETRGSTDTKCALSMASGQRVSEDDDSGEGFNCRIVEALEAGATYRIEVRHFSEGEGGDYELYVGLRANHEAAPEISLNRAETVAGDALTLTGHGFAVQGFVVIEVKDPNDRAMDEVGVSAGADGRFSYQLQTARNWSIGGYRVRARDRDSGVLSEWVAFAVRTPPADDHGNRREDATRLAIGGPTGGEIHVAGDEDWFHFEVDRVGTWAIETRGRLDTRCTLFAPNSSEVATSDDEGDGLNCRIEVQISQLGAYAVKVDAYGGATGFYELWLVAPPVPDDHGNTRGTATVITGPVTVGATIGEPGDVDLFGFTAAQAGIYDLSTFGFTDTYCVLYDQDGAVVFEDDDSGLLRNCSFRRYLPAQRTYFLLVRHADSRGSGTYSVLLERPAGAPADDHGNSPPAATLVPSLGTFSGAIETAGDHDVFRVSARSTGRVTFATIGDSDTYCHLYDDGGDEVAINDDDGDRTNCRIEHNVTEGRTYYLKVRLYRDSADGIYRLRIQNG
jgi:hypothetical protein